MLGFLLGI